MKKVTKKKMVKKKITKKELIVIAIIITLLVGLGIEIWLLTRNREEDSIVETPYDYGILYKNKNYSDSANYNRDAVSEFSKLLLLSPLPTKNIRYDDLLDENDDCIGEVKFIDGIYKFSSTCKNDEDADIHVDYVINTATNLNFFNKDEDNDDSHYNVLDTENMIITDNIKVKNGNNTKVIKLNNDGTLAWEVEFKDYVKSSNNPSEYGKYKYNYLGFLSNNEYDVLIFEFVNVNTDEEKDEAPDIYSFIVYKVDEIGNIIDRKVIHENINNSKIYNNKFYYMIDDDEPNTNNRFLLKVLDNNGNITIRNKIDNSIRFEEFDIDDDYVYFIKNEASDHYCIISILDKDNKYKSFEIFNSIIADYVSWFKYYKGKYFAVVGNEDDGLVLYVFDNNGEFLKTENLLPGDAFYYQSFIGFDIKDDVLHIYYNFSTYDNLEYRDYNYAYDHIYDIRYSSDLSETKDTFYVDSSSYLFLGKNKYSIYPTFYENEDDYKYKFYTVEISK